MDIDFRTTSVGSHWNRSTSQPATPKRSPNPNRVKAKPANPKVISSILTSLDNFDNFDTLAPLPANDQYSEIASRHSRQDSSHRSVDSTRISLTRNISSPGFGVEYGRALELDDEEGATDAALPPTIPTSRPPSGLSNRNKRLSFSKSTPKAYFGARSSSRRNSLSTIGTPDRHSSAKHKLSSESWVRQNNERVERDDWPSISRGRTTHRSVRRVTSQEMLRPAQFGPSPKRFPDPQRTTSLAEQIIARNPPPPPFSTKGRLYLTDDATITENRQLEDSPPSPTSYPDPSPQSLPPTPSPEEREEKSLSDSKVPSEEHLVVKEPLPKVPSPITDSIPTRTSSLRISSNSPAGGKKRSKKSKRLSGAPSTKSNKMKERKPSPILDSSWADLDEEDETVKRIKQLREQRKSRLQETTTHSYSSEIERDETAQHAIPVCELTAPPLEGTKQDPENGPVASRTLSEPDQPHNLSRSQSNVEDRDLHNGDELDYGSFAAESPIIGRHKKSVEIRRPQSAHVRPVTSRSEHSAVATVSSDYSNPDSVGALESVQLRGQSAKGRPSRESTERRRSSLRIKGFSISDSPSTALPQHRPSKKAKKPQNDQAYALHPDLPHDFEKKKSRRKSMSDAKAARAHDAEEELARQDSIENAVMDYLYAPRLSRKVKHPTTGRIIAFSEVGDPEGAAVFICVGMGLTRYVTAFYDELATMLRLRLITIDRPGVGASEPFPSSDKSGPLNWPEDVLTVSQHLGIVRFSIMAHSAGAIYALATALILPHLVKGKVHLLAPWVPPSQLDAISHPATSAPPSNPLPRSQRFLRVLPTPFLKVANSSFMTATSASLQPAKKSTIKASAARTAQRRHAGPVEAPQRPMSEDRPEYNRRESMMLMDQFMPSTHPLDNYPLPVKPIEDDVSELTRVASLGLSATATPADPSFTYATVGLNAAEHTEKERLSEYTTRLTEHTWDLATRDSNPATDLLVCLERHRDVGFRYTDVGREVVITHGSEDKRVPIANVKWLAEQMNRRAIGMNLGATPRESRESHLETASIRGGGCELRVLQGEGHGLMASPKIMGDVLTEIAGYWIGPDKGRLY